MYREQFLVAKTDGEKKSIIIKYLKENPDISYQDFLVRNGALCGGKIVIKLFGKFSLAKEAAGIVNNGSSIEKRLFNKRKIDSVTNCWNWVGSITEGGYGQIGYKNKMYYTHRLSYKLFVEEIPEGILVRHKCDNKLCFNPEHLELGTYQDNNLDTLERNKNIQRSKTKLVVPKHKNIEERIDWYRNNSTIQDTGCLLPPGKLLSIGYKQL